MTNVPIIPAASDEQLQDFLGYPEQAPDPAHAQLLARDHAAHGAGADADFSAMQV